MLHMCLASIQIHKTALRPIIKQPFQNHQSLEGCQAFLKRSFQFFLLVFAKSPKVQVRWEDLKLSCNFLFKNTVR